MEGVARGRTGLVKGCLAGVRKFGCWNLCLGAKVLGTACCDGRLKPLIWAAHRRYSFGHVPNQKPCPGGAGC